MFTFDEHFKEDNCNCSSLKIDFISKSGTSNITDRNTKGHLSSVRIKSEGPVHTLSLRYDSGVVRNMKLSQKEKKRVEMKVSYSLSPFLVEVKFLSDSGVHLMCKHQVIYTFWRLHTFWGKPIKCFSSDKNPTTKTYSIVNSKRESGKAWRKMRFKLTCRVFNRSSFKLLKIN